jgi:threonine dehydrogenase-like Zn-dependent dehydrogenase
LSGSDRRARALWFTAARHAELREESVKAPAADQVLVRGIASLVSAGTEMRVYRGQVDPGMDLGLEVFAGSFGFPIKFAYQIVGEVEDAGASSGYEVGQRVFARHPHQELFTVRNDPFLLFQLPSGLGPERGAFANLLDVAYNAMLDVPIRIGDAVVVYGQGVIGSFCAQLARRTAGVLVVVDPIKQRSQRALDWGADAAIAPEEAPAVIDELTEGRGADISIEVSGAPAALQQAIQTTGQEGTIVVISYFGSQAVPLVLSPAFHFRRQRIVSSQVRHVPSQLGPRWTHQRRMGTALRLLAGEELQVPLSHVVPFERAPEAYEMIDRQGEGTMGVLLTYDDELVVPEPAAA